jgi:hypothetical protein
MTRQLASAGHPVQTQVRTRVAWPLALLLAVPLPALFGQAAPPGRSCSAATDTLVAARASAPREWARYVLMSCLDEVRVSAYVGAIRQSHQASREEAMSVVYLLTGIRDARLFAEVLALAGDRSASIPARVVAFMALAELKLPPGRSVRYEDVVRGPDAKGIPSCLGMMSTHARAPRVGPVPLPEDFRPTPWARRCRRHRLRSLRR